MPFVDSLEPRRLFAAGALDTTYGNAGTADVQLNARGWAPADVDAAVGADGRAVIVGVYGGKKNQFSVARLTAAGAIDATFGRAGIATMTLPLDRSGDVQTVVDSRGRTLVMVSTSRGVTVTRLTASGAPDAKFGKNGTAVVPIVRSAADLAVDANHNVFVVGTSQGKTGTRGTVVRLTYRGKLDATFGSGGAYKTPVPTSPATNAAAGNARGAAIRLLDDGRILAAADVTYPTQYEGPADRVSLFRLDADGSLDETYGTGGSVMPETYPMSSNATLDYALESFRPDGGAVVSARVVYYDEADGSTAYDKMFGRVTPGGAADALEQHIVPQEVPSAGADSDTFIAAVQADGRELAVSDFGATFRLNADRSWDPTFTPVRTPGRAGRSLLIDGDRALSFARPSLLDGSASPSLVRVTAIDLT